MGVKIEMFFFLPEGPAELPRGRVSGEDCETGKQAAGNPFLDQGFPGEESYVFLRGDLGIEFTIVEADLR